MKANQEDDSDDKSKWSSNKSEPLSKACLKVQSIQTPNPKKLQTTVNQKRSTSKKILKPNMTIKSFKSKKSLKQKLKESFKTKEPEELPPKKRNQTSIQNSTCILKSIVQGEDNTPWKIRSKVLQTKNEEYLKSLTVVKNHKSAYLSTHLKEKTDKEVPSKGKQSKVSVRNSSFDTNKDNQNKTPKDSNKMFKADKKNSSKNMICKRKRIRYSLNTSRKDTGVESHRVIIRMVNEESLPTNKSIDQINFQNQKHFFEKSGPVTVSKKGDKPKNKTESEITKKKLPPRRGTKKDKKRPSQLQAVKRIFLQKKNLVQVFNHYFIFKGFIVSMIF